MKKFEFGLSQGTLDLFFPKERIKTKARIIEVLMEATRHMLINPSVKPKDMIGKMTLYIDKMSRLFFVNDEKYYSIVFPFFALKEGDSLQFSFQNNIDVNSQLISNVLSIIKCETFKHNCSLDFAEPIYEIENDFDEYFWIFMRELLLMEDGYIRYDFDEENHIKAKENGEEHKHPLNHYDLFYSSNASFKIGLEGKINETDFINVLDVNTNCEYLKSI